MPRKARLVVPGASYHIMARCLDGQSLFQDDEDREYFLSLLGQYISQNNCRCYAWALMDSHYHLVLRLGDSELWQVMKPLNMRYAQFHAKKFARRGPLFMDRYKSIVTQDQDYLQELIRYVHLNPMRAGTIGRLADLATFPWCGDGVLMGRLYRDFQDSRTVLRRFGANDTQARRSYRQFLREGLENEGEDGDLIHLIRRSNAGSEAGRKPAGWVIGDPDFVREALEKSDSRRLRIARYQREGLTLDDLARKTAEHFRIGPDSLRYRHRGGIASEARKLLAFTATREYGVPVKEIASYLNTGSAAVSAMILSGKGIVARHGLPM